MAYFLHMSEKEQIKFVEPIDIDRHNIFDTYNPACCLYLSQVIRIDDSELSSAWREHTKKRIYENLEDEKDLSVWVNGFQNFYKVGMDDKKILIIDKREDLRKLFEIYGVLKDYDYNLPYITKIYDKIAIYLNFLKNLKKDKLDIIENHPEEIVKLVSSTKTHTIVIKDGLIVPPKNKGVTLVFIATVFSELKKLYDELAEKHKQQHRQNQYTTINWNKIRDDGYSGMYYTKNIIDAAISDKYVYDKAWKKFMQYLMTDTLIVWKDDILTMETKENVLMSFA
jgi:hypothetical protein